MSEEITILDMVRMRQHVKGRIEALDEKHKATKKPLEGDLELIETRILDYLRKERDKTGEKSVKTALGTASILPKTAYTISDRVALEDYMAANPEAMAMFSQTVTSTGVEAELGRIRDVVRCGLQRSTNGEVTDEMVEKELGTAPIPGLTRKTWETLGFRKK